MGVLRMVKGRKGFIFSIAIVMILILVACSNKIVEDNSTTKFAQSSGEIYLYGEQHGVEKILDKEFELWYESYHDKGMRHLFIEAPYYTGELLNVWMESDSDELLDRIYNDWAGTAAHNPKVKEFYEKVKSECPETIFHGTDVGHQYKTTGQYFLEYLKNNKLEDSEQYVLTQEAIEQGKYYYEHSDDVYRENMMVENFIREFDKLGNENIMGIYGAAHTGLADMDFTNAVPCMANQLKKRYGDNIYSEDLSKLAKEIDPERIDTINVAGKEYEALYFGKQDLPKFKEYAYREFWRLENAYEDFQGNPKTQDHLPEDNYPMRIDIEQVFVIDYTKTDGSIIRMYYRSDGDKWGDMLATVEFTVE